MNECVSHWEMEANWQNIKQSKNNYKKKEKKREIDNLVKGQLQAKIINFMVLFAVLLHKPKRNELHEKKCTKQNFVCFKKGGK